MGVIIRLFVVVGMSLGAAQIYGDDARMPALIAGGVCMCFGYLTGVLDAWKSRALAATVVCGFLSVPTQADAGHCRVFFQQHHAVAVQQVVAVQPLVLYQAGADIQEAALVEKIARRVAQLTAAAPQSIPQTASPSAFAKCAACHSAANPAGGLVFDGTQTYDCQTYAAWGRMAGLGEGVPDKMRAVIGSLTPEEKGAINEAILRSLKLPAPAAGELK